MREMRERQRERRSEGAKERGSEGARERGRGVRERAHTKTYTLTEKDLFDELLLVKSLDEEFLFDLCRCSQC